MSNRYSREVSARALVLASNASDVDEFAVPHEHEPGECVDCDAQRILVNLRDDLDLSLHRIRRMLGGHGGESDPLGPKFIATWQLTFASEVARNDAQWRVAEERLGVALPDPSDAYSFELRIALDQEDLAEARDRVVMFADSLDAVVSNEEVQPLPR